MRLLLVVAGLLSRSSRLLKTFLPAQLFRPVRNLGATFRLRIFSHLNKAQLMCSKYILTTFQWPATDELLIER